MLKLWIDCKTFVILLMNVYLNQCFLTFFLFLLNAQIIACLDVRVNDKGDLVTKGDQYDVREHSNGNEVYFYSTNYSDIFFYSVCFFVLFT